MDHNHYHQCRRMMRFSFKNATVALTVLNLLIFLFLLEAFFTSSLSSSSRRILSAQLRYIKEAEEIRIAMQPLELIKRVPEIIEQEGTGGGQETEQQKDVKQNTAVVDLSNRLLDFQYNRKHWEDGESGKRNEQDNVILRKPVEFHLPKHHEDH